MKRMFLSILRGKKKLSKAKPSYIDQNKPNFTHLLYGEPIQQPNKQYQLYEIINRIPELYDFDGDRTKLEEIAIHLGGKGICIYKLITDRIKCVSGSPYEQSFFYAPGSQNGNKI